MSRNKQLRGSPIQRCKGAAAVEFAIVAPLFFLLVFGMIEFGRALNVKHALCNATRDGAKLASVGGSEEEVQNCLENRLKSSGIAVSHHNLAPKLLEDAKAGEPITVKVSVNYKDISWLPPFYYICVIEESTTMRKEGAL